MSFKVHQTKFFIGEVVSKNTIKLLTSTSGHGPQSTADFPKGLEVHKSTIVSKHPVGSIVEVGFRAAGDVSTISSIKSASDRADYMVVMTGVTADADPVGLYNQIFDSGFGAYHEVEIAKPDRGSFTININKLKAVKTASGDDAAFVFPVAIGLRYYDAVEMSSQLRDATNGSASFYHRLPAEKTEVKPAATPMKTIELTSGIWIPDDLKPMLPVVANIMEDGGQFNIAMLGPSGYGKTSLLKAIANHLGLEFHYLNCSIIMSPTAWFGFREARGGETIFEPTAFSELLVRGRAMLILDEVNRTPDPTITNALFSILDDTRGVEVHNTWLANGPSLIFGLTMNVGFEYVGTNQVDRAFINRTDFSYEVQPLPEEVELAICEFEFPTVAKAMASKVVTCIREMRQVAEKQAFGVDVSTRVVKNVMRLIAYGAAPRYAIEAALVKKTPIDERNGIIMIANKYFGTL